MSEIQVFDNPEFGEVRVVEVSGEPWFVAADVCGALGLEQVSRAMSRLDEGDGGLLKVPHPQNPDKTMDVNGVNEPGLYSLILCSNKPEAKAFKRWITHEVIPSIRKTGGYIAGQETMSDTELMAKALIVAQRAIAQREARISALTVENEIMLPKAEYFDELVDRNTLTSFRETAKMLGVKPKAFLAFLLERKYVFRDQKGKLLPYEVKNDGLFALRECFNDKTKWSGTQTLITPKGRETFRLLLPLA